MNNNTANHAHLITGGFPPGSLAGHDHDYARLRLLGLLAEQDIPASVGNDFADVEKWLPVSRLLITYVAGPYPDAAQCAAMQKWLQAGGHWLALHGTSGGKAERVEGMRSRLDAFATTPGGHVHAVTRVWSENAVAAQIAPPSLELPRQWAADEVDVEAADDGAAVNGLGAGSDWLMAESTIKL